eukprot:m.54893 g.54893  ORF g.54893 m.54893 type:complete len:534 (-) comp7566_c0_seq1:162-1763(-)
MPTKRIHLWSPPRACSTALMYSFGNRPDTSVTDEPLYAYFLKRHPNLHRDERQAVLETQSQDWGEVVDKVLMKDYGTDVVFHKHMAKHLFWDQDLTFMDDPDAVHVLLIRDPVKQLASWHRTEYERSLDETGLVHQYELVSYLERKGKKVVVVDSTDVLQNPRDTLTALCEACGIPFDEAMLQWSPGPRKEDGAWAYYYYKSVHKSTHFSNAVTPPCPFPAEMKPLLTLCEPLYMFLRRLAVGVKDKAEAGADERSMDLVWVNGQLRTRDCAFVSAVEPVVHRGDAVRGCLRVTDGYCPLLDAHLARIEALAQRKGYANVTSADDMRSAVIATLAANDVRDNVLLRLAHVHSGFIVALETLPTNTDDNLSRGGRLVTVGREQGAEVGSEGGGPTLQLGASDDITNAHALGLCLVLGSTLVVPPVHTVTLDAFVNAALDAIDALVSHVNDITSVEHRSIALADVKQADEILTLDMASGVQSIHMLDGASVGCRDAGHPGKVTQSLRSALDKASTDGSLSQEIPSWGRSKSPKVT